MNIRTLTLLTTGALVLGTSLAHGHHSATAYDLTKIVPEKGVLKEFNFVNPHVNMVLAVKQPDGSVIDYMIEGNPPGWFRRAGIRSADFTKGVGQEVTVDIHPSKDGKPVGYFQKMTFADGTFVRFADVQQ